MATGECVKFPLTKLFGSSLPDHIRTKYRFGSSLSHRCGQIRGRSMPDKNMWTCWSRNNCNCSHTLHSARIYTWKYYETALCVRFILQEAKCQWFLFSIYCMSKIAKASSRGRLSGKEQRHRNRTADLNFIYNLHLSVSQWHLIIVHNLHYSPCRVISASRVCLYCTYFKVVVTWQVRYQWQWN